jgi:D-serine deaminase-like pyridoxal phosphate-dependent protein
MPRPIPAQIGMSVDEIETPALVVDADAFERNIRAMGSFAKAAGVRLRPHAKAHKCPEIVAQQIANGAVGVCCQKVSEAEVFVETGVEDILITNQVIDSRKLSRVVELARSARISMCVDDPGQVYALGAATEGNNVEIDVLVEIDVGHRRCGLTPGPVVAKTADLIGRTPGLRFGGLQAYHGAAQHFRSLDERQRAIAEAASLVRVAKAALAAEDIRCPQVSGAGTGSFPFEVATEEYTEIQPGSYIFMDADYAKNEPDPNGPSFLQSLLVHATVMSIAVDGQAVLDAGYKALSVDSGYPVSWQRELPIVGMSDEHTRIRQPSAAPLKLGERVRLAPGHIDPTVNLHDWYVVVRNGVVEALWPVAAKGPGL